MINLSKNSNEFGHHISISIPIEHSIHVVCFWFIYVTLIASQNIILNYAFYIFMCGLYTCIEYTLCLCLLPHSCQLLLLSNACRHTYTRMLSLWWIGILINNLRCDLRECPFSHMPNPFHSVKPSILSPSTSSHQNHWYDTLHYVQPFTIFIYCRPFGSSYN